MPLEILVGPVAGLAILLMGYKFLWPAYKEAVDGRIAASDKRGDEWKERALAAETKLLEIATEQAAFLKKAASE